MLKVHLIRYTQHSQLARLKARAHGPKMGRFSCRLGRSGNQLGGAIVQLNPYYNQGKTLCMLHNVINMKLVFYPKAINTLPMFYPMIKLNVFFTIFLELLCSF